MDHLMGLLRLHVQRGVNLAVRDATSSDPYVEIKMGKQRLRTPVVKKNINPEWNEDMTHNIRPKYSSPSSEKTKVYDHDTFSLDDKMGDAEFDVRPFLEARKMGLVELPNGTIIRKIQPNPENCLAEESCIIWSDGKVVQNLFLRLKNVECGELELQLQWVDIPGSRGL